MGSCLPPRSSRRGESLQEFFQSPPNPVPGLEPESAWAYHESYLVYPVDEPTRFSPGIIQMLHLRLAKLEFVEQDASLFVNRTSYFYGIKRPSMSQSSNQRRQCLLQCSHVQLKVSSDKPAAEGWQHNAECRRIFCDLSGRPRSGHMHH